MHTHTHILYVEAFTQAGNHLYYAKVCTYNSTKLDIDSCIWTHGQSRMCTQPSVQTGSYGSATLEVENFVHSLKSVTFTSLHYSRFYLQLYQENTYYWHKELHAVGCICYWFYSASKCERRKKQSQKTKQNLNNILTSSLSSLCLCTVCHLPFSPIVGTTLKQAARGAIMLHILAVYEKVRRYSDTWKHRRRMNNVLTHTIELTAGEPG